MTIQEQQNISSVVESSRLYKYLKYQSFLDSTECKEEKDKLQYDSFTNIQLFHNDNHTNTFHTTYKNKKVSSLFTSFFNFIFRMILMIYSKKKNDKKNIYNHHYHNHKSNLNWFHMISSVSFTCFIIFCLWLTKLIILDPFLSFPSS